MMWPKAFCWLSPGVWIGGCCPTVSPAREKHRNLARAAHQFIVQRGSQTTAHAGSQWFGEWGRDTMIALPGLTLATGRYDVAKSVLLAFAGRVDRGMLPNRFPGES